MVRLVSILVLFMGILGTNLFAQTPHPKSYICHRSIDPITIDGVLDESSWQKVNWTDEFVDIEGDVKPLPNLSTRVKMLWDDQYFYIAAELEEPHIWATLKQRDTVIFYDNDFEIFIDPNGDNHEYFELEINAYGTVWDLFLTRPYRDMVFPLNGWDAHGLKSAIKVYGTINKPDDLDEKWTIEIAIPWKSLKECAFKKRKPIHGEQWRVNFSRVQWITDIIDGEYVKRKDEHTNAVLSENNWVWSPTGKINMHMPEMWGYVQFSKHDVGEHSDEFIPDPDWDLKMKLLNIYYLQYRHKKKHGNYALTLSELGDFDSGDIKMTGSSKQYIVCARSSNGKKLSVNHESKIWYE